MLGPAKTRACQAERRWRWNNAHLFWCNMAGKGCSDAIICRIASCQNNNLTITLPRNSASLSSFLLLGMAQVNYERLLGSRHGLMAEGSYSFTSETWTIGAAYRFHFKKSLKGTFGYVFSRFGQVYYTVKENTDTAENEYQMETELKLIGLGIGHRWQWDSGWAIVLRGGCGIQIDPKYTWSPTEPSDKHTKDRAQNIQSLDLELSIGYSF